MKLLIVDDEPPARGRLKRLVESLPDCEVAGEASNGQEALNFINDHGTPDVILLDIRMPEVDGLETARHLTTMVNPPAVIFTTAYGDHALEAFDAQALDYLLKPIRKERLEAALHRAKKISGEQIAAINADSDFGTTRRHIPARRKGGLLLIPVKDIHYFQADQKYVTVFYTEGEVLIEDSLVSLEREFGDRFVRLHRNALAAREYLIGMERSASGQFHAVLRDCDGRPEISRRHAATVKKSLQANNP